MIELLWILPILLAIALVLGGTRGDTLKRMFCESGKSFAKLVAGIFLLCVAVQVVLHVVPLFY